MPQQKDKSNLEGKQCKLQIDPTHMIRGHSLWPKYCCIDSRRDNQDINLNQRPQTSRLHKGKVRSRVKGMQTQRGILCKMLQHPWSTTPTSKRVEQNCC